MLDSMRFQLVTKEVRRTLAILLGNYALVRVLGKASYKSSM